MQFRNGSLKLFSLAGIGVYVHWMWLLAAVYSLEYRTHEYSSFTWNVIEYLSLFAIVLTHEFGHQLACRSVGGQTHDIVLWLLGGVAYPDFRNWRVFEDIFEVFRCVFSGDLR